MSIKTTKTVDGYAATVDSENYSIVKDGSGWVLENLNSGWSQLFTTKKACVLALEVLHGEIIGEDTSTQKEIEPTANSAPHLVVTARAGTGKTFTLVQGIKYVLGENPCKVPASDAGVDIEVNASDQQWDIWNAMAEGETPDSILFCAFNASIAKELSDRVPKSCEAMTLHRLGGSIIRANTGFYRVDDKGYKLGGILECIKGLDFRTMMRKPILRDWFNTCKKMVGLCKQNMVPFDVLTIDEFTRSLTELAGHHMVETELSMREIAGDVKEALKLCMENTQKIDFDDMIWLPLVLGMKIKQRDMVLVDEAQDLNPMQQQLVMKVGKRIIACGDDRQAIYGFAGADVDSIPNLVSYLGETTIGVKELKLTKTYRCGHAIVAAAKELVPDYEADDDNCPGEVRTFKFETNKTPEGDRPYTDLVEDEDMILCRVNAPLVSQCFKFITAGRKAYIQGRSVGADLVKLIKKSDCQGVAEFIGWLDDWFCRESERIGKLRYGSDSALINLNDRKECLLAFCDSVATDSISDVIGKIQAMFSDKEQQGIRLSSVHKAKGLEADNVYVLLPEGCTMPHAMAKSEWQIGQEWNLKYVAITRAIKTLTWVVE